VKCRVTLCGRRHLVRGLYCAMTCNDVVMLMLQAIKDELSSVQPSVTECHQTAEQLSTVCGSPSDISIQKCISNLDTALSDIEEGLDDRELELNRMMHKAQQCTSCLDVCNMLFYNLSLITVLLYVPYLCCILILHLTFL